MAVGRLGRLQCEKEHLSEGCNAHAHHASVFKALVIPIQFHISRIVQQFLSFGSFYFTSFFTLRPQPSTGSPIRLVKDVIHVENSCKLNL